MIDAENEIFNTVYNALVAEFGDMNITGNPTTSPSEFPCASIYEADSYAYAKTQDSSGMENHARVMYEVNVFSNHATQPKTECKKIFDKVDKTLASLGFTRVMKKPFPANDASFFRLIGRYEAVISKNKSIYRR